jgi:hypothetical protein
MGAAKTWPRRRVELKHAPAVGSNFFRGESAWGFYDGAAQAEPCGGVRGGSAKAGDEFGRAGVGRTLRQ